MISDETSSDSPLSSSGRPNARARSGQASTHIGSLPSDMRSEHPSHFELCLENGSIGNMVRTRHGAVAAADAFLRIDAHESSSFYAWPPSDTHERIRAARNDCTTGRRGTRTHLHGRVRVNRPCTIRPRNRSHADTLAPKEGLDSRRTPSRRCGNPCSAYCRNRTREPKPPLSMPSCHCMREIRQGERGNATTRPNTQKRPVPAGTGRLSRPAEIIRTQRRP